MNTSLPGTSSSIDETIDRTSAKAHETVDRVAASVDPVVDRMKSAAHDATQRLQSTAETVARTQAQWSDDVRTYVRDKPLVALGVTALAAFVISRLLAR